MTDLRSFEEFSELLTIDLWPEEGDEYFKLVTYQGYDPKVIAAAIASKSTGRDLKQDITMMVSFAIERGSQIDNILKKSSSEGKKTLEGLKTSYGLKISGKSSANDITLPRVALTFPWIASSYLRKYVNRTTTVRDDVLSNGYPRAMRHAAFASLIPGSLEEETNLMRKAYVLHQVEFTKVITKKKRMNKSYKELADEADTYIRAGIDSQWIPEAKRIEYCKAFGLLSANNKVTNSVRAAATEFDARYIAGN